MMAISRSIYLRHRSEMKKRIQAESKIAELNFTTRQSRWTEGIEERKKKVFCALNVFSFVSRSTKIE